MSVWFEIVGEKESAPLAERMNAHVVLQMSNGPARELIHAMGRDPDESSMMKGSEMARKLLKADLPEDVLHIGSELLALAKRARERFVRWG